jgi:hypothetical protein
MDEITFKRDEAKEILSRYFMGAQGMISGTYRPETIDTLVDETLNELATLKQPQGNTLNEEKRQ